ncbi:MAG: methionyl-tRNA formyltransferase [Gammaproteobacteria bacterium]
MDCSDVRVAYLAHGRAGLECLRKMLFEIGVSAQRLFVLTYELEDNDALIALCRAEGVTWSTGSIKSQETLEELASFSADIVVSMHFRELIPAVVFATATFGGFNLHPSLLPKYRGCFSGVWAIINGEQTTGVTYHFLNERFDDGNIISQSPLTIAADETGYSLFHRLIDLGVSDFVNAFRSVVTHNTQGSEQIGEPSYFGRALPYGGMVDPAWADVDVDRFIRALSFPGLPGAQIETLRGPVAVNSLSDYKKLVSET